MRYVQIKTNWRRLRSMTSWRCWSPKLLLLLPLLASPVAVAEVTQQIRNNGNLILEDIPEIPDELVASLNRYQNVRSAVFRGWSRDSNSLFVMTGFGNIDSLHRVDAPLGARRQLTFFSETIGEVARQPGQQTMLITRDTGGSEFSQIFRLDPDNGDVSLMSDGESRNGSIVWDRRGSKVAFQSTRRNGASNDVWMMDADDPDSAELVLESPDGTWWGPAEFSVSGRSLLAINYVSVADSRILLIDLDSGAINTVAGGADSPSVNYPVAFDDDNNGFWLTTDRGTEFEHLAWQSLEPGSEAEVISGDIPWNVTQVAVSDDRQRMAFITNEDGQSKVYLLDPKSRDYQLVEVIPTTLAFGLAFSPDGRRLAMTLNNARTPSDAYVLALGEKPLQYTELTRWTESEVGGLDTTAFRIPELIHYPTFDDVGGEPRTIPAWVYKPSGDGPHPVVISIHGGPASQSRPSFSATYQMWLAKLGVAVIRPNVRGSTGYGKTYVGLDDGFQREDSVKDIGALLDWIDTQEDLDADRVAVFGGSYGGYMVLASAVHYSDRLKAGVDIVGISNFVTFLENTQDYRRDLRRVEYGDERQPKMRAFLEKTAPLNNIEDIRIPMLIVQGENDPRVPVTEAVQMVEALRSQGHSVWYMNALDEGHGYRRRENRNIYQQATVLFLQQHLAAD